MRVVDAHMIDKSAVGAAGIVQYIAQSVALDSRVNPRDDVARHRDLTAWRAPNCTDIGFKKLLFGPNIEIEREHAGELDCHNDPSCERIRGSIIPEAGRYVARSRSPSRA